MAVNLFNRKENKFLHTLLEKDSGPLISVFQTSEKEEALHGIFEGFGSYSERDMAILPTSGHFIHQNANHGT